MTITIHRGAAQIGGCVTEIKTSKAKILIDFGSNLPGAVTPDFSDKELDSILEGVDAIFYTHFHGDHVGLFGKVPDTIPQYIGEGAKEVMLAKYHALKKKGETELVVVDRMRTYKAKDPITQYGDIEITPYYCSHSAFDSYMFLIKAGKDGPRILHTGDFRGHGYMGKALVPMLKSYAMDVDVLITEGTMLSRGADEARKESLIQKDISNLLVNHKCVFILCSSTDIDRMASVKEACKRNHRYMYVDRYQESVLDIFTKFTTSPLYDFSNKGKRKTIFVRWKFADYKNDSVIFELRKRGFVMPIRQWAAPMVKDMLEIYADLNPLLMYSMWHGYYDGKPEQLNDNIVEIRSLFKAENVVDIHTSGHSDVTTLAEVCRTVDPRVAIIPIHKDAKADFCSLDISDELKSKVVTESTIVKGIEIVVK